jgi:hypothetical protein
MGDAAHRHTQEESSHLATKATTAERTLEFTTHETTLVTLHSLATAILNFNVLIPIT